MDPEAGSVLDLKRERRRLALKALGWKVADKATDAARLWVLFFATAGVAFLAILPYLYAARALGFLG